MKYKKKINSCACVRKKIVTVKIQNNNLRSTLKINLYINKYIRVST